MKRMILILAMLLMAATSYNQSTRKTNNVAQTAPQEREKTSKTTTQGKTSNSQKSSNQEVNPERKSTSATVNKTTGTNSTTSRTTTTSTTNTGRQTNSDTKTENKPVNKNNAPDRTETDVRQNNSTRDSRSTSYGTNNTARHNENIHYDRQTANRSRVTTAHTVPVSEYYSTRTYREHHAASHYSMVPPKNRHYRESHYVYRKPVNVNVYWTPVMHRRYCEIYPMIKYWYYPTGYRIETISSYNAAYYLGEVMNVYGRVSEVFYSRGTDEYFLYFGTYYPYQDFTVVIPGYIARNYSMRPVWFFENQDLVITGLITSFEGNPEIVINDTYQLNLY